MKNKTHIALLLAALLVLSACTPRSVEARLDALEDAVEQKMDVVEDKVEQKLDTVEDVIEGDVKITPAPVPKAETPVTVQVVPAPKEEPPAAVQITPVPKMEAPASAQTGSGGTKTTALTKEQAQATALEHAGFTADQVSWLHAEYDVDDGVPEYDVQFHHERWEYEYEIHAETGDVLSVDVDD